jgi:hypothetical protein
MTTGCSLGERRAHDVTREGFAGGLTDFEVGSNEGQCPTTNSMTLLAAIDNPLIAPPEIVALAAAAGAAPFTL